MDQQSQGQPRQGGRNPAGGQGANVGTGSSSNLSRVRSNDASRNMMPAQQQQPQQGASALPVVPLS
ncbi:hypothetical protein ABTB42_20470, partial [Acinetobacter baumannii]